MVVHTHPNKDIKAILNNNLFFDIDIKVEFINTDSGNHCMISLKDYKPFSVDMDGLLIDEISELYFLSGEESIEQYNYENSIIGYIADPTDLTDSISPCKRVFLKELKGIIYLDTDKRRDDTYIIMHTCPDDFPLLDLVNAR